MFLGFAEDREMPNPDFQDENYLIMRRKDNREHHRFLQLEPDAAEESDDRRRPSPEHFLLYPQSQPHP